MRTPAHREMAGLSESPLAGHSSMGRRTTNTSARGICGLNPGGASVSFPHLELRILGHLSPRFWCFQASQARKGYLFWCFQASQAHKKVPFLVLRQPQKRYLFWCFPASEAQKRYLFLCFQASDAQKRYFFNVSRLLKLIKRYLFWCFQASQAKKKVPFFVFPSLSSSKKVPS